MKNYSYKLTLIGPLLLLSIDTFARAGGGSGSGSGGGGGPFRFGALLIWAVYTVIVSYVLYRKIERSKKLVREIAHDDSFWNFAEMRIHARKVFFQMQDAWRDRNIESVKEIITPELYANYKMQLESMKILGHKNILSGIDVQKVKIIGCEDFVDNNHDRYIAYISGKMLDYTLDEKTKYIIKNEEKKVESFVDTYHFIRKDNQWILAYIDNEVGLVDLVRARNYKQKMNRRQLP